jgi:hypothetical protein
VGDSAWVQDSVEKTVGDSAQAWNGADFLFQKGEHNMCMFRWININRVPKCGDTVIVRTNTKGVVVATYINDRMAEEYPQSYPEGGGFYFEGLYGLNMKVKNGECYIPYPKEAIEE